MFRHLMKLIWKRKSRNMMLSLEIFLAFVIVFAIAAFAARNIQLYQLPTGFNYRDVWSVTLLAGEELSSKHDPEIYEKLKRGVMELPEVEKVAFASFSPFTMSTSSTSFGSRANGSRINSNLLDVSDDFFATTGMALREGRWFSSIDNGAVTKPVVINQRMANALAPGQSALGKEFSDGERGPSQTAQTDIFRVVGVVDEYRGKGDLMSPVNFSFMRAEPHSETANMRAMLIKVRPGTERSFEAKLNARLKLIRNDWRYEISPLSVLRSDIMATYMIPLIVLAVIGVFMLAMVGFGLFGVLWQNTTRRIPEIGLRRAVGASASHIYQQIIAEQMLLSTAAMLVALALLVQLPITGALGESLNWTVFAAATALSMLVIYLISLLCSVYPGWRASRLSPTEALHYE